MDNNSSITLSTLSQIDYIFYSEQQTCGACLYGPQVWKFLQDFKDTNAVSLKGKESQVSSLSLKRLDTRFILSFNVHCS